MQKKTFCNAKNAWGSVQRKIANYISGAKTEHSLISIKSSLEYEQNMKNKYL